MGQINLINAGVAAYLLISGLLVQWLGKSLPITRQHQLAFVTITVLVFGNIPLLGLPMVAPGILFSLGMMLFALHLSAYYSGTTANSAHLYAVILLLSSVVLIPLSHTIFEDVSFSRFLIMGVVGALLLELEKVISEKPYILPRIEKNLMWIWFVAGVFSLWDPQVKLLPDFLFLLLLMVHLQKRWPGLSIPAPLISLYGLLFIWHAHFSTAGLTSGSVTIEYGQVPSNEQLLITIALVLGFLGFCLTTGSLTKRLLLLFLAQEVLLIGMGVENLFIPSSELISLQRLLLFIGLSGLFVMVESKENEGLDKHMIQGLLIERPRFSTSVVLASLFFAMYPLIYITASPNIVRVFLVLISLLSIVWAILLISGMAKKSERKYRILRPSLSIWSTVVFTILWAAVVILEIISRYYFS